MINELKRQLDEHNAREREEDLILERLETQAHGLGGQVYGDDASHSGTVPDRMERSTIKIVSFDDKIAPRRIERTALRADTADFFFERLDSLSAYIMTLYIIEGLSMRQIARKIGRSAGYVHKAVVDAQKNIDGV